MTILFSDVHGFTRISEALTPAVLNESFARRGWSTLKIGMELNSGNGRVGDMGSRMRRAYCTQQWDPVEVSLLNLPRMGPDCERYRPCAGQGAEFRRTPSAGWDGVTVFDEK